MIVTGFINPSTAYKSKGRKLKKKRKAIYKLSDIKIKTKAQEKQSKKDNDKSKKQ